MTLMWHGIANFYIRSARVLALEFFIPQNQMINGFSYYPIFERFNYNFHLVGLRYVT